MSKCDAGMFKYTGEYGDGVIKIPCPWLKKEDGKYYCMATEPPTEIKDINEEYCLFPASIMESDRPYYNCKRWVPT